MEQYLFIVLICCRVVNGYTSKYNTYVHSQFSVLLPCCKAQQRHSFRDVICEIRIMFAAIFSTVVHRTCTEAGSRRGINDSRRRHQRLLSLMDFRCKGVYRCGRYPVLVSIYMLSKEGKKEPTFMSAQAWRPATSELIAPLYHSLLLQSPSIRTHLWPIGRRPVVFSCYRPCIKQGGDGSLPFPCVRFYIVYSRGGALYRPLCSVLSGI